ncbi:hypothetical protein JWJ90_22970, partial [Desulfobulbus rhabdoformis]|uniref:hypothetical protein n=1 Tax=Desulfobulbus rhabdoformis TaxID=34032 RepID=UPI0019657FD0
LLLSIAYKNIGLSSLYNGFGHVLEKAGKEESAELVKLVSQAFAAATALEQSVDDQLIAILEKSQSNEE